MGKLHICVYVYVSVVNETNPLYFSMCQRVEEQERESNNIGKAVKLVKGKVGKPKVKKIQLEETLPSPFGRRVEPQITLAMKADASRKMTKKKKVRQKESEKESKSV